MSLQYCNRSAIEQDGKMEVKDLIVANKTVDSHILKLELFVSDDVSFSISINLTHLHRLICICWQNIREEVYMQRLFKGDGSC